MSKSETERDIVLGLFSSLRTYGLPIGGGEGLDSILPHCYTQCLLADFHQVYPLCLDINAHV